MKRLLRILILGTLYAIVTLAFVVVWPIVYFFSWLVDDPIPLREAVAPWFKALREIIST